MSRASWINGAMSGLASNREQPPSIVARIFEQRDKRVIDRLEQLSKPQDEVDAIEQLQKEED